MIITLPKVKGNFSPPAGGIWSHYKMYDSSLALVFAKAFGQLTAHAKRPLLFQRTSTLGPSLGSDFKFHSFCENLHKRGHKNIGKHLWIDVGSHLPFQDVKVKFLKSQFFGLILPVFEFFLPKRYAIFSDICISDCQILLKLMFCQFEIVENPS